jgi:hypothetical protein
VQYRGIPFDIKASIARGEWGWVIRTPKPRHGKCSGTRQYALLIARRAIDAWCLSNPHNCDDEINVG